MAMRLFSEPFQDTERRLACIACRSAYRWLKRRGEFWAALEYGIVADPSKPEASIRRVGIDAMVAHGLRRALRELRRLELRYYVMACERLVK